MSPAACARAGAQMVYRRSDLLAKASAGAREEEIAAAFADAA